MTLNDQQIAFWTELFEEEFEAERGSDDAVRREVHRRVLREHAKDTDRDQRAAVGRLRQEVRVRFFRDCGYIERSDSRGTMRFVAPDAPDTRRRDMRRPRPSMDGIHWGRWSLIAGTASIGLFVFGIMLCF